MAETQEWQEGGIFFRAFPSDLPRQGQWMVVARRAGFRRPAVQPGMWVEDPPVSRFRVADTVEEAAEALRQELKWPPA